MAIDRIDLQLYEYDTDGNLVRETYETVRTERYVWLFSGGIAPYV